MSALRTMVSAARARIAEGRPLVIFPEGTRVPPGSSAPYHAGIAALQGAIDVPVVPVALNSGLFWPWRSMALRGGRITLEFLPALPRELKRREFIDNLEKSIENASKRLLDEAITEHGFPRPEQPVDKSVQ